MAITQNHDGQTGLQLDGIYYRVDRVVINRKDIEIVVTGYASQEVAQLDYTVPLIQTRSYTFGEYDKTFIHDNPIFECAYKILKTHEDFKSAEDVLEPTE